MLNYKPTIPHSVQARKYFVLYRFLLYFERVIVLAWAPVTKYHRLGSLNTEIYFSQEPWGLGSQHLNLVGGGTQFSP